MSDWPVQQSIVVPQFVSTTSAQSAFPTLAAYGMSSNPATMAWVANQAQFTPVTLPWPYPVRRLFMQNGGTITTTSVDFAIYGWDGTKVYGLGTTAMAAAPQYTTVTPFVLPPGRYYFAWVCDNTTARARGWTTATTPVLRLAGVLQQALGSASLPATMASAGASTQAIYNIYGVTRSASGF